MAGLRNVNAPQLRGAGLNFIQGNPMEQGFRQQQERNRLEDKRERAEEKRKQQEQFDKAARATVNSMYAPEGGASPDPMSRMGGGSAEQASPGKQPTTLSGKLARVTADIPGQGRKAIEYASQAQRAQAERYQRETEMEKYALELASEGNAAAAKAYAQKHGINIPEPVLEDARKSETFTRGAELYADDKRKLAQFMDRAPKNNYDLSKTIQEVGPPSRQGGGDFGTVDERRVRDLARQEALDRTSGASLDFAGENVTFDEDANPNARGEFYENYNAAYRRLARRYGGGGRSPYAGMGRQSQQPNPNQGGGQQQDDPGLIARGYNAIFGDDAGRDSGQPRPQPQQGARANQRQSQQRQSRQQSDVPEAVRNPEKIRDKLENPKPPPASRNDLEAGQVYNHPKHGRVYYDGNNFWPMDK